MWRYALYFCSKRTLSTSIQTVSALALNDLHIWNDPRKIRHVISNDGGPRTSAVTSIKISARKSLQRSFPDFFPSSFVIFLAHTEKRWHGQKYLLASTRGVPRGEWQLQTVHTQARSSDPASNGRSGVARHGATRIALADPQALSLSLYSHVLSSRTLSPAFRASHGRYPTSGMAEESRTPFRDIRISFIHTNFGTNLDLRKLPAAHDGKVLEQLSKQTRLLQCKK